MGRTALLAQLDQLMFEDRVDRWVVVTGGPGMGKSALLAAWLARREAADAVVPHHFIRRGEYDWDDPRYPSQWFDRLEATTTRSAATRAGFRAR